MLVLSRRSKEKILIGDDIEIQVIETRPGKVRLGVTAPAGVVVLRAELLMGGAANESEEGTSSAVCGADATAVQAGPCPTALA